MTKGNIVFVIPVIIAEPGSNMFEANAKLPTVTSRDYGLGVFFVIFPKS